MSISIFIRPRVGARPAWRWTLPDERVAALMRVKAGILNFNRSTNNASGLLPFGGVGLSGNFRPSGSMSPRLCTVPVAVMEAPFGALTPHRELDLLLQKGPA